MFYIHLKISTCKIYLLLLTENIKSVSSGTRTHTARCSVDEYQQRCGPAGFDSSDREVSFARRTANNSKKSNSFTVKQGAAAQRIYAHSTTDIEFCFTVGCVCLHERRSRSATLCRSEKVQVCDDLCFYALETVSVKTSLARATAVSEQSLRTKSQTMATGRVCSVD